jgi:UDP-N-acetylglucosamine transferase subunit ALG13
VFDSFHPAGEEQIVGQALRVLVTVGTMPFTFDRLIRRVDEMLPPDAEVTWQVGGSTYLPRRGRVVAMLPASELQRLHHEVDVVVAHAGIGSALMAVAAGHAPILVPRERRFGEHVDDHQREIAHDLDQRGLAVQATAATIGLADILRAAARRVDRAAVPPRFIL